MLAVLALVCFVALFDVTLGALDLVTLGLAFVAAQSTEIGGTWCVDRLDSARSRWHPRQPWPR